MRKSWLGIFLLGLPLCSGCGNPDNSFGELSGTATIDGQPITAGVVTLVSPDGTQMSTGYLTGKGTFLVKAPPVGKMKVYIDTSSFESLKIDPNQKRPVDQPGMSYPDPDQMGMVYKPIPEKYKKAETTDYFIEVKPGKMKHDITLSSK